MKNKYYFSISSGCKEAKKYKNIIKSACDGALLYLNKNGSYEISVSFVTPAEIKEINNEYRNIDKETDVLSFPVNSDDDISLNFDSNQIVLGDIVISYERALNQAYEYGHSIERELAFLSVHSVLHLLGYDHETSSEDEKEMLGLQNEILEYKGFVR